MWNNFKYKIQVAKYKMPDFEEKKKRLQRYAAYEEKKVFHTNSS